MVFHAHSPRSAFRFSWTFSVYFCIILGLLNFTGCGKKGKKTASVTAEAKKITLTIKGARLFAEIADTPEKRASGLMFRSVLGEDQAMLFIFEQTGIYPFYMKNTKIPLSIAFIDSNRIIIDIQQMTPDDDLTHHYPNKPFLYALETNQGWFFEKGIKPGDTVFGLPH